MLLSKKAFGIKAVCLICIGLSMLSTSAQTSAELDKRKTVLTYSYAGIYVASSLGFYQLWYKDYEQSSFHFFNDNNQWLQVDKIGHAFSSYTLTRYSAKTFNWAGHDRSKSAIYASAFSFTFLTTIEMMDAYSKKWGFSWGDFMANSGGISLYLLQDILLQKQAITLKYSYQPSKYRKFRTKVLGENQLQAMFKDYNAQTYWLSVNLNDVFPEVKPQWLNLSFGYSGDGMVNSMGSYQSDYGESFHPKRQYFLSVDFKLEKIQTKRKWLKVALSLLDCVKVPLPALEVSSNDKPHYHWLYF